MFERRDMRMMEMMFAGAEWKGVSRSKFRVDDADDADVMSNFIFFLLFRLNE